MLLYSVSDDYINYLLTIDRNVMFNKDRPYAGLLFELNEQKWYAPLTSFKEGNNYKPSYIWLYAVHDKDDGNKITAYIKFRSMIPVADCCFIGEDCTNFIYLNDVASFLCNKAFLTIAIAFSGSPDLRAILASSVANVARV